MKRLTLLYYKLPRFMKYYVSRLIYHPKLGKRVYLYGWPTFSANVEIGDYTF